MRVTDEAIDKIKQMIAAGELRPGDRLPREPDLAAPWATVHIAGVERWIQEAVSLGSDGIPAEPRTASARSGRALSRSIPVDY